MPLEAVSIDPLEQLVHLSLVVDIFGKHVLVRGVPRRAVNEQIHAFVVLFYQFT
jgi:hypothetical protein